MLQSEQQKSNRSPIWAILLCTTIPALNCLWVRYTGARQRSPEQLAQQAQNPMPRSGALVGLPGGQTLWIAPIDGRIQILAAPDYIVPRKDGFWHVRFDVKWAPLEDSPAEAVAEAVKNDPALSGVPPGYGRLWAVPLKKGMNAAAWPPEQPITGAEAENNQKESQMEEAQAEQEEGPHQQQLLFLSPEYLSFYQEQSSGGRISEFERILSVTDSPGATVRATELLLVHEVPAPISNSKREKDLITCIDPDGKEGFREEDFLRSATIGIRRKNQKWVYSSVEGNENTVFAACAASVLPPKRIVGSNDLFPAWKQIKISYPGAEDAFSSPSRDLVLVFASSHLIVTSVHDGNIGKPLADILAPVDRPVMVQWAIGKYVDAWNKELAPYFHAYTSETQ